MAQQRKDDYVQQCRAFFHSADQRCNCDGRVNRLELCKELRDRGFGTSAEEIVNMFDDIDANDDDTITEEEFMAALQKKPAEEIDEQRLRAEFNKIDADGSGFITMDELTAACQAIGMQSDEYTLDMDTNDDGKVDLQEFLRVIKERAKC